MMDILIGETQQGKHHHYNRYDLNNLKMLKYFLERKLKLINLRSGLIQETLGSPM